MSFKKTSAFIKGSWDGVPDESNFIQSETLHANLLEFTNYVDSGITNLLSEYDISGDIVLRQGILTADGKVMITTKEFVDEATWNTFRQDSRWDTENVVTKKYDVEEAPTPEQVNTFDEINQIYYHSSAHLF